MSPEGAILITVETPDVLVQPDVTEFLITVGDVPGPTGAGLPTGGLINQMIRKTSSVIDHATEWFDLFAQVAGFRNYQAPKTALTPGAGATATVDVSTNYDYTITPGGASFTLALSNIPADGAAWSVTIYAINWDGVTVTMPSGAVTSGAAGLSFTSGGGKDRVVARGNAGPAGEKEFYNLSGDMR